MPDDINLQVPSITITPPSIPDLSIDFGKDVPSAEEVTRKSGLAR